MKKSSSASECTRELIFTKCNPIVMSEFEHVVVLYTYSEVVKFNKNNIQYGKIINNY